MIDKGYAVDSIYLDFSKAFDKVDHFILLKKINSLQISGKIIRWIESFLKNRQQSVKVEGHLSDRVWVTSGVPQGSVLGPLLFFIMMTDIECNIFNATIGSFADDTRLWNMVTDKSSEDAMQKELEIMYQWAERNNMQYNCDKFEGMRFGNKAV